MLDDTHAPRLGPALDDAYAGWRHLLRAALTRRGVPPVGAALGLLAHVTPEGVSQAGLATTLGLSKQAVQQALDHLEAHGLVARRPDPADGRARLVALTAAGGAALAAWHSAQREVEKQLRRELGRKAFKRLRRGLEALAGLG